MTDKTPPIEADDLDEVEALAREIRYHNARYFLDHAPEISDYEFDRLTRRLKALSPEHPALSELVPVSGQRIRHDYPMLSLDKAYSEQEVLNWAKVTESLLIETPKIDGLAASFKYDEKGYLVQAVTRGDGVEGELFTENARYIENLPERLPEALVNGPMEVRGEIFMPLSVFKERFSEEFSNPRNLAAGAIKQKDAKKTGAYDLSFFLYSMPSEHFQSMAEMFEKGKALGFQTVAYKLLKKEEVEGSYLDWEQRRDSLDFEIDGIVYAIDAMDEHEALGQTAHHPRWAIAYKFQGDSGESVLRDVEWSLSRTGTLTPVALVDPVLLSGAMVSRCSLHNLTRLKDLDLSLGARVQMTRRGAVIPYIEKMLEPGNEAILIPRHCPSCGKETVVTQLGAREEEVEVGSPLGKGGLKDDGESEILRCSEPLSCPRVQMEALEYWLKQVDIDEFGPAVLEQLVGKGMVQEPADFYKLEVKDFMALEGFGEKSAENLYHQVEGMRLIPLPKFLAALGISGLGKVIAETLAEFFLSLEAVRGAEKDEFLAISGLSEVSAESIYRGLGEKKGWIENLLEEVKVPPLENKREVELLGHPIASRRFVWPGVPKGMYPKNDPIRMSKKEQLEKALLSLGGSLVKTKGEAELWVLKEKKQGQGKGELGKQGPGNQPQNKGELAKAASPMTVGRADKEGGLLALMEGRATRPQVLSKDEFVVKLVQAMGDDPASKDAKKDGFFYEKRVYLEMEVGKIFKHPEELMRMAIKRHGGRVVSSASKEFDVLVVTESSTIVYRALSKVAKTRKKYGFGTKTITEAEFWAEIQALEGIEDPAMFWRKMNLFPFDESALETLASPQVKEESSDSIQGKSFMFTGTLKAMKRSEAEKTVKALGGHIQSAVNDKLDYLVAEEGGREGKKLKDAKALIEKGGTLQIIFEEAFQKMLDEAQKEAES